MVLFYTGGPAEASHRTCHGILVISGLLGVFRKPLARKGFRNRLMALPPGAFAAAAMASDWDYGLAAKKVSLNRCGTVCATENPKRKRGHLLAERLADASGYKSLADASGYKNLANDSGYNRAANNPG